jgi:hypothetical protein
MHGRPAGDARGRFAIAHECLYISYAYLRSGPGARINLRCPIVSLPC